MLGEEQQRRRFSGRNGREGLKSTPFDRSKCVVEANTAPCGGTMCALQRCHGVCVGTTCGFLLVQLTHIQPLVLLPPRAVFTSPRLFAMDYGNISCKYTKRIIGNTVASALRLSRTQKRCYAQPVHASAVRFLRVHSVSES